MQFVCRRSFHIRALGKCHCKYCIGDRLAGKNRHKTKRAKDTGLVQPHRLICILFTPASASSSGANPFHSQENDCCQVASLGSPSSSA